MLGADRLGKIREKIFKNYPLKSIDAVRAKLEHAILYIERNPKLVQSITSFRYRQSTLITERAGHAAEQTSRSM